MDLKSGQLITFLAVDEFTGEEHKAEGTVLMKVQEALENGLIDVNEYGEVDDDVYLVNRKGFVRLWHLVTPEEVISVGK